MDIVRQKKVKLIKWFREDEYILQHVQSRDLISMEEYTTLKNVSEPGTRVTELLDLMLQKGQGVCLHFLDLLKEDEVNESIPELKEWITSVNTAEIRAPQSSVQSSGSSVNIHASDGSSVYTPVISGSQISGLHMNISIGPQNRNKEILPSYGRTLNNNPRITDNQEFLRSNEQELINKIKNVDGIVDDLSFTREMKANIRVEKTDQAKMRKVLDYTNSKKAAQLLVAALYKYAEDVMEELTTG